MINILKKYDIDNRQVYSITCDNGRNIVKMVKIFNDANEDDILNEDDIEADIESENTEHLRNGLRTYNFYKFGHFFSFLVFPL